MEEGGRWEGKNFQQLKKVQCLEEEEAAQIFQKSSNYHQIPGTKRATRPKFHIKDPQTLGAIGGVGVREPLNWVILYKLQTIRSLKDWNRVGKSRCITLPKPNLLHIIQWFSWWPTSVLLLERSIGWCCIGKQSSFFTRKRTDFRAKHGVEHTKQYGIRELCIYLRTNLSLNSFLK